MTECPKCKSQKAAAGHLASRGTTVSFIAGESKWHQMSLDSGAELEPEAFACPDCGMVWTTAEYPEILREELKRLNEPQ